MKLNEEQLSLILTYMMIYREMAEAESAYQSLRNFSNQQAYLEAHSKYEYAQERLFEMMSPSEVIDSITQIKETCHSVVGDFKRIFNF